MSTVPNDKRTPPTPPSKFSTSSSSTSTTSTTVQNCHILLRNRVELLRQLYTVCIGQPMTAAILKQLLLALDSGVPWQYYEYALQESALAPYPSWRYVRAIVSRLMAEKAPADDVRGSQRKTKKVREQDYTQREYVHDESAIDAMMAEYFAEKGGENRE